MAPRWHRPLIFAAILAAAFGIIWLALVWVITPVLHMAGLS